MKIEDLVQPDLNKDLNKDTNPLKEGDHFHVKILNEKNNPQRFGPRNNIRITDYDWNSGQFLPSLPLPISLPHSMQDESHGYDSETPDYSQLLYHSLERSPSDNYSFGVETCFH